MSQTGRLVHERLRGLDTAAGKLLASVSVRLGQARGGDDFGFALPVAGKCKGAGRSGTAFNRVDLAHQLADPYGGAQLDLRHPDLKLAGAASFRAAC